MRFGRLAHYQYKNVQCLVRPNRRCNCEMAKLMAIADLAPQLLIFRLALVKTKLAIIHQLNMARAQSIEF